MLLCCCLVQHGIYPVQKNTNQEQGRMCSQQARFRRIPAEPEHIPIRKNKRDNGTPFNHDPIQETKILTTPQKGQDGYVNDTNDNDNDDNHDELLVVPFQHTISISDTAVAMTSILCLLLLSLSVMTQHLYSHWYCFKSINQSQSHSSDGVVVEKDIGAAYAIVAAVACHSFDFVLVSFGCILCMDCHVNQGMYNLN